MQAIRESVWVRGVGLFQRLDLASLILQSKSSRKIS
jgi:hypothetical protein